MSKSFPKSSRHRDGRPNFQIQDRKMILPKLLPSPYIVQKYICRFVTGPTQFQGLVSFAMIVSFPSILVTWVSPIFSPITSSSDGSLLRKFLGGLLVASLEYSEWRMEVTRERGLFLPTPDQEHTDNDMPIVLSYKK